jgi:glutathione synthase
VIAGHLTEINLTSPTGLREVERLYGLNLEVDLLDRVERLAAARQADAS